MWGPKTKTKTLLALLASSVDSFSVLEVSVLNVTLIHSPLSSIALYWAHVCTHIHSSVPVPPHPSVEGWGQVKKTDTLPTLSELFPVWDPDPPTFRVRRLQHTRKMTGSHPGADPSPALSCPDPSSLSPSLPREPSMCLRPVPVLERALHRAEEAVQRGE